MEAVWRLQDREPELRRRYVLVFIRLLLVVPWYLVLAPDTRTGIGTAVQQQFIYTILSIVYRCCVCCDIQYQVCVLVCT